MSPSLPLVSIVIPAFNEERTLAVSVPRIRAACDACPDLTGRYELIVCDNNSTDRTAEIAEGMGCTVVFEKENQIARARNRGAAVADGEWLLFIDADSWPSAELMKEAAAVMAGSAHAGCGSTIHIVDGPWWFKRAWESKNFSMRLLRWCPGGFILCRHDLFSEIGGFPEDHYIFEEADFVKRLKRSAAKHGLKFVILHRHPFHASGRKGTKYGFWSWMGTAIRLWVSPRRLIRDQAFAEKWYDPRR